MNKISTISAGFLAMAGLASAQMVSWQKSYWGRDFPLTSAVENFSQDQSGEDWPMKHVASRDANGKLEGFVTAGFNDFVNRIISDPASCPTTPGYRRWTENGQPVGVSVPPVCAVWESTGNKRGQC